MEIKELELDLLYQKDVKKFLDEWEEKDKVKWIKLDNSKK